MSQPLPFYGNSGDIDPKQAVKIQRELRAQIKLQPFSLPLQLIGGADLSFNIYSTTAVAAFVVLKAEDFSLVDQSYFVGELRFPYIPGFLSFREAPLLLEAWRRLKTKPDLLFLDGQGIAHPRRMGIATHFGILVDFPTLGCAKSRLIGRFQEPANEARSYSELMEGSEKLGFVYRTKKNTLPIFVSPGNRMDLQSTLEVLNSMNYPHRIPEPTRQAHLYANQLRVKLIKARPSPSAKDLFKKPIHIPKMFSLIRQAIQPYAKAAMFELSERGYTSVFQQLVGCMISIRTLDEVSLTACLRLFELAASPKKVLNLPISRIAEAIAPATFQYQKALRIHEVAQIAVGRYGGELPCDRQALLTLPGIGPKCASLALGISCGIPAVSVDTHVFRVTHRWGLVQSVSAEKASLELEEKLPKKYWIELNALLVPFGKNICTGILPKCSTCPVLKMCQQVGVTEHA